MIQLCLEAGKQHNVVDEITNFTIVRALKFYFLSVSLQIRERIDKIVFGEEKHIYFLLIILRRSSRGSVIHHLYSGHIYSLEARNSRRYQRHSSLEQLILP